MSNLYIEPRHSQLVHSAIVPSQLPDPTVTLGQLAKRDGSDYFTSSIRGCVLKGSIYNHQDLCSGNLKLIGIRVLVQNLIFKMPAHMGNDGHSF